LSPAAGFKEATGIQVWGPLPSEGQEAWGTPLGFVPLRAGHKVCSSVVLVRLVAGMAVALLAHLKVSACFYVSLKGVGLRHQQHQSLPEGEPGTCS